jgi:hypothetical protein
MKTRPWRYLVEFHHHNNTDCPQPAPKPGRGLIKVWGTGDLPLCAECERLNRLQNPEGQETDDPGAEARAFADVDQRRDPD